MYVPPPEGEPASIFRMRAVLRRRQTIIDAEAVRNQGADMRRQRTFLLAARIRPCTTVARRL